MSDESAAVLKRKELQIRCCLAGNVESTLKTGFERYYLVNQSLPEMAPEQIDTSCTFLGKPISAPFVISPMTGGIGLSRKINRNLAKAAQELGIVVSVGSQRLALEDPSLMRTYQVREVAPDIPVLANLGAVYLNYEYSVEECQRAVDMIEADGLSMYFNPLQKILQGRTHSKECAESQAEPVYPGNQEIARELPSQRNTQSFRWGPSDPHRFS